MFSNTWASAVLGISSLLAFATAQVTYTNAGSKYSLSLGWTQSTQNGSVVSIQLAGPVSNGWTALGTGGQMSGSTMFIIYPNSGQNGVTVSVRTASGHDTPHPITSEKTTVVKSSIANGIMTAQFDWKLGNSAPISLQSSRQAYIWAVGPGGTIASSSQGASISEHSDYGTIFINMKDAEINPNSSTPKNNTSVGVIEQPSSYDTLKNAHALLLGVSFVVIYPLAVIGLRWNGINGFKVHWIMQVTAATASIVGLIIAIAMCIQGILYKSFDEAHQILGIALVSIVLIQMPLGYLHHRNFVRYKRRTIPSYLHIGIGRVLIYGGILNAALGFLLSSSKGKAAAVAIIGLIIASVMEFFAFRAQRRRSRMAKTGSESADHVLLQDNEMAVYR